MMQSSWDMFTGTFNDAPAVVLVDSGFMGSAPLASHPDLVLCRIPVRALTEDRFPTPAAFEIIYRFEDGLNAVLGEAGDHHYVGRLGMPHQVMFHIYTNRPADLVDAINSSELLLSISEFRCSLMPDPTWDAYRDVLLPGPETRNNVENEKVRQGLISSGDDLTMPRTVDHFAYFEDIGGLNAFRHVVAGAGYDIVEAAAIRNDQGLFALSFAKNQNPSELDPITWSLHLIAEKHKGLYDGWACPVVRATK
jgi:regulator of RNase E activity RraB